MKNFNEMLEMVQDENVMACRVSSGHSVALSRSSSKKSSSKKFKKLQLSGLQRLGTCCIM